MRSRIRELHDEYCAPKPLYHFKLWDSAISSPPVGTPEAEAEHCAVDVYVHLVT